MPRRRRGRPARRAPGGVHPYDLEIHDPYALLLSGATGQELAPIDHVPPWELGYRGQQRDE